MRYLRKQVLNRRAPWDQRLSVDINNAVVMNTTNNLTLPTGTSLQRPVLPANGMIRYNTTVDEIEVYQASTWRSLRFKESTQITQQNLGAGDSSNVYFGPLNPAPPISVQSNTTWGAQNILVIVESVIQLATSNYVIEENPTIPSETYNSYVSEVVSSGSTIIPINSHVVAIGISGSGSNATLLFNALPNAPFAVGSIIIVSGFKPTGYNGTYTVTDCTTSSVSYANVTIDTAVTIGDVVSTNAIYPSVNITSAGVSGTNIDPTAKISSYVTHLTTNALLSITLTVPTTGTVSANAMLTIIDDSEVNLGHYIKFSSPVPYGKTVTVLHGFDK